MPRRKKLRLGWMLVLTVAMMLTALVPTSSVGAADHNDVRFATFNASLNRFNRGDLKAELAVPGSAQPDAVAEVIQRTRPDVLLINEFDWDGGAAARHFQNNYLGVPHGNAKPIWYPYRYVAASNTGYPSKMDLNNDGSVGGPDDAFGFGFFRGQFAFVVYSMYPIDFGGIRTFQHFLWKDMPGALLPDDPATPGPADWYSPAELDIFRLSSKNHVDVPIWINGETVHFLISHPTPPVFDGAEDRNGTRNHDEIRFWRDYVAGDGSGDYIYDDTGGFGGLGAADLFVIAGDLNSDPFDGDSIPGSAQLVLDSARVNDSMTPSSVGGKQQAKMQGDLNLTHLGNPSYDTADFAESAFGGPGNLRADYVLPEASMTIVDSGVFWPGVRHPLFGLVGPGFPTVTSDHRLVHVDVLVGP